MRWNRLGILVPTNIEPGPRFKSSRKANEEQPLEIRVEHQQDMQKSIK